MGAWGIGIFSDDLTLGVKGEYGALLAIGLENDEAEEALCQYYHEVLEAEGRETILFWLSLAWSEWKRGRLSDRAKEKALTYLDNGGDLAWWALDGPWKKEYKQREKALNKLKETLLSPMPPKRKANRSVRRCPWKAGSLLAYKIMTDESLKESPYFGQYVLLRVVKVKKRSHSKLFPDALCDTDPVIGLYGWHGDEIPDPAIVNELEYISICESRFNERKKQVPQSVIDGSILQGVDEADKAIFSTALQNLFSDRVETCFGLGLYPNNGKKPEIVCLDVDSSFEEYIPPFFKTDICSYTLGGFNNLDYHLCRRMTFFDRERNNNHK